MSTTQLYPSHASTVTPVYLAGNSYRGHAGGTWPFSELGFRHISSFFHACHIYRMLMESDEIKVKHLITYDL